MSQGDPESPLLCISLQNRFSPSSVYESRLFHLKMIKIQLKRRCMGLCFWKVPRGQSLLVWMDPEVQMMSVRFPSPSSLNSVCFHSPAGSCHVAERWLVVAPGLCCPDCLKAREESCLALKFHQSPREDSDWSRPEPITVDLVTFVLLGQPHRNHIDFCRKGER